MTSKMYKSITIYELTTPHLRSWSWSLLFDDIKTLHEGIKGSKYFLYGL